MELILVDTSIWVDHFNRPLVALNELMLAERCVLHPFVLGEIALGNLPDWERRLKRMREFPSAEVLTTDALLECVAELGLQGSGLGFVDAHLLAWVVAEPARKLWSRDKKLVARAERLDVGWGPADDPNRENE